MIPATLNLAHALVEAPSPSGDEAPALLVAERLLREIGLVVRRQPVGTPDRFNLWASLGRPRAVLTTHLDTVPAPIAPRIEGDVLHGRGACDAKGVAAAMIAAASDLVSDGRTDFGLLFVVGEETTSDGALAANALLEARGIDWPVEASLLGEPTDGEWVSAHAGVLIATLTARGRAAHSSQFEEEDSAIAMLLDVLEDVRCEPWPDHDTEFPTQVNVGRIEGGVAANVVASSARAEVMFRGGAPPETIERRLRELAKGRAEMTVHCGMDPVRFEVPAGATSRAVRFATDAPCLPRFGRLFLMGPGSIRHAHADDEQVTGAQLEWARQQYASWVIARLAETAR